MMFQLLAAPTNRALVKRTILWAALLSLTITACKRQQQHAPVFTTLTADSTGLHFSNTLKPEPAFNLFSYMYFYNGAGVATGDFNQDGRIDIFLAANQQPNKLYLNKGNLQFDDVTAAAQIPQDGAWSTGVSVADVNADGLLDIYVCRVGKYKTLQGKNQLLVCQGINAQGIPAYKDEAAAYGLDFSGFSTQAAFFDYDLDGDLDMFLLNHSVNHDGNYAPRAQFTNTFDSLAGQRLYRNDSRLAPNGTWKMNYTHVTSGTGIQGSRIGYGLGVVVTDVNNDGWPDLYIGNDFHENDYLYVNQRNGTFADESTQRLNHTSQFSMGVDAGDLNNDAFPELVSMDMLPYAPQMLRRSLSEDDYNIFQHKLAYGYSYQYARNNLQVNLRNGKFSEAGQYAGIYATDWTWAALMMDFDNDGYKDLFISNGIPKRMNDIDYINFVSGEALQQKLRTNTLEDKDLALINKFPEIKLPNQFFKNNGQWQFDNLEQRVTDNLPTFSNGAAYADFDNDGDLDIVVNNINDKAILYRNNLQKTDTTARWAQVRLQGQGANTQALGTRLLVYSGQQVQRYDAQPVHGFLSSMQGPLHISMPARVDSAMVIWPDNSCEPIALQAGKQTELRYKPGLPAFDFASLLLYQPLQSNRSFADLTEGSGLQHTHTENRFNEFDREPLIPHMLSTEGPALAVADINADGWDDVFMGGAKGYSGAVYLGNAQGQWQRMPQPALEADSMWEHVDAVWTDVNGDKAPDLVIATGGNEYYGEDEHLKPLLYLNDGKGMLTKKADAFGALYATQSKVLVQDVNDDGKPDIWLMGRAIPWQYGATPNSYVLQNDGTGRFSDVTAKVAPELQQAGMITDAFLNDINGDKQPELVVASQWGGIQAYSRQGMVFKAQPLLQEAGWWQSLYAADVDADGDTDIIAGNYGLNHRLKASAAEPVRMYVNDFDDNGRPEQVLTYYLQGQQIPFASKLQLEKQMPLLKKKYLYAEAFSKASLQEMFGEAKLKASKLLQATQFAHQVLLNDGKGHFTAMPLPAMTQWSTLRGVVPVQANDDSLPDYLLLGNFTEYHVELGRQDADNGLLLINRGKGQFAAEPLQGNWPGGEVRKALPLRMPFGSAWLFARNGATAFVGQLQPKR